MATNIQIDFSDVSAFAKEIKSFNTSLTTLERNTERFSNSINTFGSSFGQSSAIFKELKENIQGVDTIFRGIASAMTGIAKIPNLDTQIGEFNKFVDGIKRLDASGTATVKNITAITNAFNGLARLQAKGNAFNLQPIVNSIQELIRITSGATNLAEISANLNSFAKALKALTAIDARKLNSIGTAIAQGLKSSEAIEGANEFGHKIADAIIKATKDGLGIKSPSLEFIQIGLDVVRGLAVGISSNPDILTSALKGISATLVGVFSAIAANQIIPSLINLFKFGKFVKNVRNKPQQNQAQQVSKTAQEITDVINAIGGIPTILPVNANSFRTVAKTIADIINIFSSIPDDRGKLEKLFGRDNRLVRILSGIRPFMELLNETLTSIPQIDPKLASSFRDIFKTIFSVLQVFGDVKGNFGDEINGFLDRIPIIGRLFIGNTRLTKVIKGIRPFAKLLAEALRSLTNLGLGGANAVRAAATAIRSIRDIITVFTSDQALDTFNATKFNRFEKISTFFGRSTKLTALLKGIRPFTKLLADALRNFKNIPPEGNLRAVATSIESIADLITVFSKLDVRNDSFDRFEKISNFFKRSTRLTNILKGIRPLTKLLADAINNFKKIKVDPNILQGAALFIQGLGNLLGTIARNDINEGNAKKIGNVIKTISEALAEGISVAVPNNKSTYQKAGASAIDAFFSGALKSAEIASPSKRMIRLAGDIYSGFAVGINRALGPLKSLGTAFIKVFASGFNFIKDAFSKLFGGVLQNVRQFGQQVTQSFSAIISNLRNTAKGLVSGGLTTAATGGFASFLTGNLVTLTASFDSVITTIGVFGKITGDTLSQVQDDILRFSAVTKFGPAESAQAFLDLQKAGLGVAESLKTLPAVGAFATAGQIDLANATTLALTSMNGFGLGIENINEVIDTFVGGADISTAGVTELASALGFVAPSANALSISIQDTTAALALLNDQAISGERAGTGLRAVLDALAAPTDEAKQTLQSLGITLTDNEGNFVGLSSTISQFSVAIDELRAAGAGDVEIINQLSSLGDRNAISTLLALIKEGEGTMVEFADGTTRASTAFDDYRKNLESANKASEIASSLSETIQAKIESLKGSIQVLIINAFQPLLKENIAPIVDGLIEFFNRLSKLPKPILKFGAALVAVTAIMTTLAGIVSVFVGLLIFSVIPALQLAGAVFAVFFNPVAILATGTAIVSTFAIATPVILAFGAALTLVGGILFKFYSDIKNNTGGARDSFNGLLDSLDKLRKTFGDLFGSAVEFFNAFKGGVNDISAVGDKLNSGSGVTNFLNTIQAGVDKITKALSELKLLFDFFANIVAPTSESPLTLEEQRLEIINQLQQEGITGQVQQLGNLKEMKTLQDELIASKQRELDKAKELREEAKGLTGEERQRALDRAKLFEDRAKEFDDQLKQAETQADASIGRVRQKYLIKSGDTLSQISRDFGVSIADILKANPEITDPNLIFAGRELIIPGLDTTAVTDDATELQKQLDIIDAKIAARRGVERGLDPLPVVKELTKLQKITQEFSKTNLFKTLFGDDEFAIIRAVETVGKLEGIFDGISKSLRGVTKGLGTIFNGKFKTGVKQIAVGLSGVAFQVTNLFETITGVDISDELQKNLSEGNLRGVFNQVAKIVGNAFSGLVKFVTPYIVNAAKSLLSIAIRVVGGLIFSVANKAFGVDLTSGIFVNISNVFTEVGGKIIETIGNVFSLIKGDIQISTFFTDLFDIGNYKDKLAIFVAVEDIEMALDELRLAFVEFGKESGITEFINELGRVNTPSVDTGDAVEKALKAIATGISVLSEVVAFIGPLVLLYGNSIARLLESIEIASKNTDTEKLKDIGLALFPIAVALALIVGLPTLISLAAIATGFLGIYIAINLLAGVIDPVLNFLQDVGDLIQAVANGDFQAASGELRELFGGLGDIIKGAGIGSINAFTGLLETLGKLTNVDLSSYILFFNAAKELLLSDKSLGELLNIDFDTISLDIEIMIAQLKVSVLSILEGFGIVFRDLINGIIDVINKLPLGDDVAKVELSSGLVSDLQKANAELDKLQNKKVTIEANVQLAQGVLSEGAVSAINTGGTSAFSGLIKTFIEEGFSASNIRQALADASQSGAISSNSIVDGLLSSVQTGDITAEQAAALVPTNLIPAFQEAVEAQISTLSSEGVNSPILNLLSIEVSEEVELRKQASEAGKNTVDGFSEGVESNVGIATQAIKDTFGAVKSAIASILETNSPSLYTYREGLYLVQGLQLGIQQNLFLAFAAVEMLTGTLSSLKQGVIDVQMTIMSAFSIAALVMDANVLIMQASIERLVGALYGLNFAAATTLGTLGAVVNANVGAQTAVPSTTTGSTAPRTTVPTIPSGTTRATQGFGATRSNANSSLVEALKKTMPVRNVGRTSAQAQEPQIIIDYGGVTINNANPNYKMTPDDIAKGLKLHEEQNPATRKLRNRL